MRKSKVVYGIGTYRVGDSSYPYRVKGIVNGETIALRACRDEAAALIEHAKLKARFERVYGTR